MRRIVAAASLVALLAAVSACRHRPRYYLLTTGDGEYRRTPVSYVGAGPTLHRLESDDDAIALFAPTAYSNGEWIKIEDADGRLVAVIDGRRKLESSLANR